MSILSGLRIAPCTASSPELSWSVVVFRFGDSEISHGILWGNDVRNELCRKCRWKWTPGSIIQSKDTPQLHVIEDYWSLRAQQSFVTVRPDNLHSDKMLLKLEGNEILNWRQSIGESAKQYFRN
jgi:hypothetical protein